MDERVLERFHALYSADPVSGCWLWQGKTWNGYGSFYGEGKTWRAHRWSLYHLSAPFDLSLDVMHSCDNPPCVNPEHLKAVTTKENLQDMARKRRQHLQVSGLCQKKLHNLLEPGSRTKQNGCRLCFNAWQREYGKRCRQKARIAQGKHSA